MPAIAPGSFIDAFLARRRAVAHPENRGLEFDFNITISYSHDKSNAVNKIEGLGLQLGPEAWNLNRSHV
jgi:hypothetical protein